MSRERGGQDGTSKTSVFTRTGSAVTQTADGPCFGFPSLPMARTFLFVRRF